MEDIMTKFLKLGEDLERLRRMCNGAYRDFDPISGKDLTIDYIITMQQQLKTLVNDVKNYGKKFEEPLYMYKTVYGAGLQEVNGWEFVQSMVNGAGHIMYLFRKKYHRPYEEEQE